MKRISKELPDDTNSKLITYSAGNPQATWDVFRNFDGGKLYKEVKDSLFSDQGDICAYCEANLNSWISGEHNRRIEHFCSKGHPSNIHLIFNWSNLFGVCRGGTDYESQREYLFPENLSCDSHKEYIEKEEQIPNYNWVGRVLNPSNIPEGILAFEFDKKSNKLQPNQDFCVNVEVQSNIFDSTEELLEETLRVFNLNCDRLIAARYKIFLEFEKLKFKCNKQQISREYFLKTLGHWLNDHTLPFTSTRQSLVKNSPFLSNLIKV